MALASFALVAVAAVAARAGVTPSLAVRIDATAKLLRGGSTVVVTGRATCQAGQGLRIRGAMVQRSSGAYSGGVFPNGHGSASCLGRAQQWTISSANEGSSGVPRFKLGAAEVCVLVSTHARKIGATGLIQSCRSVSVTQSR